MDALPSLHPTDQTLNSYGLGKLDQSSAEAVNAHLEECSECRNRVAGISSDSFLDRVRDAQKGSGQSSMGPSQAGGTQSYKSTNAATPFPADTLPPGLAEHPDYQIKRELGRGGMGVVYLAHNALMGRDEVLKVMGRPIMERPGVLERFLREIRAVAKLRHPNIVTAYSAVRVGESIVFAMEYVEGLDLSKLVKAKGPLPVAHACNFVAQAALGLQHAHEEGLVHRDIKPANLMLSRKGVKATVKVLDFGLAKVAREEKVDGGLTSQGQSLGTPDFIAPEQILDAQGADIRADIYSLGGTLYYLLSGRPPFQANSLYDIYQAHISRDADLLNIIRPEVPSELAALVAKMLAKDPSRRFQTPGEVAQALAPFFKKGSVAFKSPLTDVSLAGRMNEGRPVTGDVSRPTRPATEAGGPVVRARKPIAPTVPEGRWESLIDIKDPDSSIEATPAVAPMRRPPWVWPSVAVGILMFGFLAAWLGGVFRVKTPEGVIVLENVPKDSEILVDGDTITFKWPGIDKPLEIRAVAGQRKVEVKKDGFKTFGEVVTLAANSSEEVTVRLEPQVVAGSAAAADTGGLPTSTNSEKVSNTVPLTGGNTDVAARRSRPGLLIAPFNAETATKARQEWSNFLALPVKATNSIGMNTRLIPPGEFLMGSTLEQIAQESSIEPIWEKEAKRTELPQHRVRITQPFYLGEYEVTREQFAEFVKATGYRSEAEKAENQRNWKNPGFMQERNHPVVLVTWNDATAFCDWLSQKEKRGYRLPTEAEWEYACRAGTTTLFQSGDELKGVVALGNIKDYTYQTNWLKPRPPFEDGPTALGVRDFFVSTAPVGSFRPNAFGLYDMHGNVSELCHDWFWEESYKNADRIDPQGPPGGSHRVRRGGGYGSGWKGGHNWSALRVLTPSSLPSDETGFRVALSVPNSSGSEKVSGTVPDAVKGETGKPLVGKPPVPPAESGDAQRNQAIQARLSQPIPMKYARETPLEVVLKDIARATAGPDGTVIPIYVDPIGLQEAEKTMSSPITLDLEGVPLETSLRLALKSLGMDYCVKDGVLYISDGESVSGVRERRPRTFSDGSPESAAVVAKLNASIPMRFAHETPLEDVLKSIKAATVGPNGRVIPIHVDPIGLQEAEKTMTSPVTIDLEGVPLRTTLEFLLNQIGMTYYVEKGVLSVTSWDTEKTEVERAR